MSTTAIRSKDATTDAPVGTVEMKLEVITIPVSDVDRAKEFYESLGWRLDAPQADALAHLAGAWRVDDRRQGNRTTGVAQGRSL
jgi:catechol 2,3-dioxygenase-like lactoylglutathione lyase family enzyme